MLCHWCGFLMIREVDDGCAVAITPDHLRPKDGRFRDAVAAHRICNTNRGHSGTIPYAVHERVHRALLLMGIPEPSAPIPVRIQAPKVKRTKPKPEKCHTNLGNVLAQHGF